MAHFRLSTSLLLIAFAISQAVPYGSLEEDSSEHGQYPGPVSTTCKCGWTNKKSGRIVGGTETKVNEYPHMVGLMKHFFGILRLFCGGTIITPNHVITAAHCTYGDNAPLHIVVGEHDLTTGSETPHTELIPVESVREHEFYSPRTTHNDIAILTLRKSITFTQMVGPICMPKAPMNSFLVNKVVKVTGWGTTTFKGTPSTTLLKVNLRAVPLEQCARVYNHMINPYVPTQICTYRDKKDACQGDSGGPVTWLDPDTNRYTLVGLVSFGNECATRAPGVNTDVSAFIPWIQSKIGGEQMCYKM